MADHPEDAATPPEPEDAAFVYGDGPIAPEPAESLPPESLPPADLWQAMMLRWIGAAEPDASPLPGPQPDIWW